MWHAATGEGIGETPDPMPHARVTWLLRMAFVAGLAFVGWFVLAALAGTASAAEDHADAGSRAEGPVLEGPVLEGPVLERTTERNARPAEDLTTSATGSVPTTGSVPARAPETRGSAAPGRLLRAPSATVDRLVSGVPALRELRPAADLVQGGALPDRHAVRDLLSPLTERIVPDALLTGRSEASSGGDHGTGTAGGARTSGGTYGPRATPTPTTDQLNGACIGCEPAADAPTGPRPLSVPGQEDSGGALSQTGQGQAPVADVLSSSLPAVPAAMAVPGLPAAAPKPDAAPADPATVPD